MHVVLHTCTLYVYTMLSRVHVLAVLYAPVVGSLGLDMVRKVSRSAAWTALDLGPLHLLDECSPWYPEMAGYAVCCLKDGTLVYIYIYM